MALKVTQVGVWRGDLRDAPGGLADALEAMARGGASVEFVIARRNDNQPGIGQVFVTPLKGKRAADAARAAGLSEASNVPTLRVEGADRPGLGSRITRAIADAGVNVRGVSAAVIGNKFVAYIGLDSNADAESAARALKSVGDRANGAGRPATRGRAGGNGTRKKVTTSRRRRG